MSAVRRMAVTEMMCGSWVEAVAVLVEMEGRKKDSHFIRFIFLGIGIFLFISTLFHLFASNSSQYKPIIATETFDSTNPLLDEQEKITESYRHHQNKFHSTSRVAVIIPYVGTILPSWFRSFLFTAQLSSHYCDWFIFVTSVINISTPFNVHLIYIDEEELANRIVQMDLSFQSQDSQFWSKKFIELLHLFPYMLVEYKPALGWIFEVAEFLNLFSDIW